MKKEILNKVVSIAVLIFGVVVILSIAACIVALAIKFIFWIL
jgi:hypothetical protein